MATIVLSPHTLSKDRSDIKAEVTSSNTVGYQKIQVPVNRMNIIGIQFQSIGSNGMLSLQDITVDGYAGEGSDWIKVYDPATARYTTVTYWNEEMGGVQDDQGESLGAGWGDDDQVAVNLTLTAGQAVWTQSEAGGKLVTSGEVPVVTTISVPVNRMTLVSNPLPKAISLQDIGVDGYAGEGSDWIKIYDPATARYTTVTYWNAEMGGVQDDQGESLGAGWGDDDQIAVNLTIGAGQGFWTQSEEGGALVFPAIQ